MIVRCSGVHWLIMLGQSRAWCSPEKHTPLTPDRKIKSDYSLVNRCCQFALSSFCVIVSCRVCLRFSGLPSISFVPVKCGVFRFSVQDLFLPQSRTRRLVLLKLEIYLRPITRIRRYIFGKILSAGTSF